MLIARGPEGRNWYDMVIFLPIVLLLLVFALASGATSGFFLLPTIVALGAGVVVIRVAMRDGRAKPDPSVRTLPTDHLRRQMYRALRPPSSKRRRGGDEDAAP